MGSKSVRALTTTDPGRVQRLGMPRVQDGYPSGVERKTHECRQSSMDSSTSRRRSGPQVSTSINRTSEGSALGYDRAVEVAQEFLGDLGIVDTSDPGHARATESVFIIEFKTAADALGPKTVVLVDRASGDQRFVTVDPADPDPWPDAKPIAGD